MNLSRPKLWAWIAALFLVGACGTSDVGTNTIGSSTQDTITGVAAPGNVGPSFFEGAPPAPSGSLTVSVASTGVMLSDNSVLVRLDAGISQIAVVFINVLGTDGHWFHTIAPGMTVIDVLLTIARTLPASVTSVTIVVEVQDVAGNVSAPVTLVIPVPHPD